MGSEKTTRTSFASSRLATSPWGPDWTTCNAGAATRRGGGSRKTAKDNRRREDRFMEEGLAVNTLGWRV
jgi:hypothetical protein